MIYSISSALKAELSVFEDTGATVVVALVVVTGASVVAFFVVVALGSVVSSFTHGAVVSAFPSVVFTDSISFYLDTVVAASVEVTEAVVSDVCKSSVDTVVSVVSAVVEVVTKVVTASVVGISAESVLFVQPVRSTPQRIHIKINFFIDNHHPLTTPYY